MNHVIFEGLLIRRNIYLLILIIQRLKVKTYCAYFILKIE